MERGRTFYISLLCGIAAFALLIVSMNLPAQLVFETKPYARLVLMSGKLDNLTADSLGLEQSEFDLVKNNYADFLKRNRAGDDSYSDDSDSDDDERNDRTGVDAHNTTGYRTGYIDDSSPSESESSSDLEGGEDSDDSEEEQRVSKQRIKEAPISQHIGLGLFHGRVCEVSKERIERCHLVSTNEAIYRMGHEVKFMINDINMAMWNNLRVESIFSSLACAIGLAFLLSTLRPCCDSEHLPKYLSALAFSVSGVLVFIPIVRLWLVSSDFQQNLQASFIVTTKPMTSWSIVVSGLASPLVFAASFSIIASNWMKMSKKFYNKLKVKAGDSNNHNEGGLELSGMHQGRQPPAYADINHGDVVEGRELINGNGTVKA